MKIVKIAENGYFVPSYSEQTIQRAYSTETTLQSFGVGVEDESKKPPERPSVPKAT